MLQSLCWALLAPTRALLSVRRSVTRLAVAAAAVAAGAAYGLWGLWVLLRSGPRGALSRKVRAEPPPGLEDGTYGQHGWLRLKVLLASPTAGVGPSVPGGCVGPPRLWGVRKAPRKGELQP
eukprot:XP_025001610.1 epoxide hydrolase 3-like [Gallus gallus]